MDHADCIFCKIVRGEIPCAKVYETDEVLAFLDIAPVAPGHALVIPKAHHVNLFDLPEALGGRLFAALAPVAAAIQAATGATGINVQMNNNAAAGQVVFHAHLHLIPRREGDGLRLWPGHPYADAAAMEAMAQAVRQAIASGR
ncbi:HIT family protein [Solidesulfovibrio alcoholivorans]|uniref:HIT family protein n=1 Tax=Solidesulfovibrio alcoholivorans TaxID=81406 RepID=UPI000497371B|nr:HIT family protein [Solidesulfovibrio alcoholivorans]